MPLDDLSLDLTAAGAPAIDVMTRTLRLPTRSLRQARAIARLQLDRLSPLPPGAVLFDLIPLRTEGTETIFALGLLRKSTLTAPGFAGRASVTAVRVVDGVEVQFRFRNPEIGADWEARWLRPAPQIFLVLLGMAAVLLAGQIRVEAWRERRLPELAAEQRTAARKARDERDLRQARADWTALDRTDAATRLLCAAAQARTAFPGGLGTVGLAATSERVVITLDDDDTTDVARALNGAPEPGSARTLVIPAETCR